MFCVATFVVASESRGLGQTTTNDFNRAQACASAGDYQCVLTILARPETEREYRLRILALQALGRDAEAAALREEYRRRFRMDYRPFLLDVRYTGTEHAAELVEAADGRAALLDGVGGDLPLELVAQPHTVSP